MPCSPTKAKDYHTNLNLLHVADRPEYANTIPDLSAFEDSLLEGGSPSGDVEALIQELQYYRGEARSNPADRLIGILRESIETPL